MNARWNMASTGWLTLPLLAALALRTALLASGAVSFHSDEAVIGLMARHINQGEPIPAFFYGQVYMGSLDPALVAIAFRLIGESVLAIRVVQSILYLGFVVAVTGLAYRLSDQRRVALIAGALIAAPPVTLTLYSTASLGGYGEIMLIGTILLWIGFDTFDRAPGSAWRWVALGGLGGLGWWTNNLIVAFALPVAALIIIRWRTLRWPNLLMAGLAFAIFSAPWWLFNLAHGWESIRFLSGGFRPDLEQAGLISAEKVAGFLLLGLPALAGIRFPWVVEAWAGVWSISIMVAYGLLLVPNGWRSLRQPSPPERYLWVMVAGFSLIFIVSSFGVDASGRYLLPLVVPLAILLAFQIARLAERRRWLAGIAGLFIAINLAGTFQAARTVPPGLTTQFDPVTDIPAGYDQQAIAFLLDHNERYGYATYTAAYRLNFLSGEAVILTPQLPFKASLEYFGSDRYPEYTARVAAAPRAAYVIANLPQLDAVLTERLDKGGVRYSRQAIGPYVIFYGLSRHITPEEMGLHSLSPVK